MENITLCAEVRNEQDTKHTLASEKKIAAVVYGKTQEPISIKLDYSEFLRCHRKAGESHIVNLEVDGKNIEVLIHDIQHIPTTGEYRHVDLYALTRGEAVHVKIALHFTGVSEAVKSGAILEEHIKEIEVKCLPRNLVDSFEVSLGSLKEMGDVIRVSDLVIDSNKYEVLNAQDDIVAAATKPAKIEVEATEAVEEEASGEEK